MEIRKRVKSKGENADTAAFGRKWLYGRLGGRMKNIVFRKDGLRLGLSFPVFCIF